MEALILVGGQGTRLRPLTYSMPKPMLPIVEKPIVARILEWLADFGVTRAVFSLGYRPDAFVDWFPKGRFGPVELAYAIEPEPLDTAGAIRFAAAHATDGGDPLIVVNGDVLTDLDVGALVEFHRDHGGPATITLTAVSNPSAYGVVPTDEDGRVVAFIEKPAPGEAPTNHINAGVYVLERSVLELIDADRPVSIEREIFPRLVRDGCLFAMVSDAYWIDTGTPEHYMKAQFDLMSGARSHCSIPDAVEIDLGVRLARDVEFEGRADAPVFIGAETRIGSGCSLREVIVGARCVLGAGSSVHSSVMFPGVVIGDGVTIEDSIIGPDAVIERGATVRSVSIIGAGVRVSEGALLEGVRDPA